MEKLQQLEQAKALMKEATTWSVMKWLREKKRVRATADEANAAVDGLRQRIQKQWPEDLQAQYAAIGQRAPTSAPRGKHLSMQADNAELTRKLQSVQKVDQQAAAARMDAEKTFDDAEKQLSTRLAREGCQKAIYSWELHERAIQAAASLVDPKR